MQPPKDLQQWLDDQVIDVELHIMPDYIAHCVACGSTNVEGGSRSYAYCLDCDAHEDSVDFVADAELPKELAKIWADAPVIDPLPILTTPIYQFTDKELAA